MLLKVKQLVACIAEPRNQMAQHGGSSRFAAEQMAPEHVPDYTVTGQLGCRKETFYWWLCRSVASKRQGGHAGNRPPFAHTQGHPSSFCPVYWTGSEGANSFHNGGSRGKRGASLPFLQAEIVCMHVFSLKACTNIQVIIFLLSVFASTPSLTGAVSLANPSVLSAFLLQAGWQTDLWASCIRCSRWDAAGMPELGHWETQTIFPSNLEAKYNILLTRAGWLLATVSRH